MGRLFEELKRRKVFRVGAVYAVAAWVLIQVADTVLPALQIPQWTVSFVTVLFILGFPIAIILAWAYEATPDGVKSDAIVGNLVSPSQSSVQPINYVILSIVLLVAGFQVADRFLLDSEPDQLVTPLANSNEQVRRSVIPLGPMRVSPSAGPDASRTTISISPDGSRLAYTAHNAETTQLYIRELNQLEPRALGAPMGDTIPTSLTFSPDGQSLAYFSEGNLKRISVNGGGTQTIATNIASRIEPIVAGLEWLEDNTIIFTESASLGLAKIPVTPGSRFQVLDISSSDISFSVIRDNGFLGEAELLPGGDAMLFTHRLNGPVGSRNIEIVGTDTTESRLLIENARNASYISTGHIVFMREGSLWAVPFDLEALQINGSEVMLIENIESLNIATTFTVSDEGDLVYLAGGFTNAAPKSTFSWVDRSGAETPIEMEPMAFTAPELSPDDSRVAVALISPEGTDIWNYELARGTLSRITFSGDANSPLWSPNGDSIIYSRPNGPESMSASGIGTPEQLANIVPEAGGIFFPTTITPDATDILTYVGGGNARAIYRFRQSLEQTTVSPLLDSPEFSESAPAISPDGRWLAYVSRETGQDEVYVRPYPDVDSGKWQISTGGGISPRWAADTGELFYRNSTDNLIETYAVKISEDGQFSAAIPELLFSNDHYALLANSYMVAADGQRFLMMRPDASTSAVGDSVDTNLVLVQNFAEELRRQVPADSQ
tara:strand:- start:3151 stop:5313 length:2163 start_codon:yes stop_codon:yes gene_type:complete